MYHPNAGRGFDGTNWSLLETLESQQEKMPAKGSRKPDLDEQEGGSR